MLRCAILLHNNASQQISHTKVWEKDMRRILVKYGKYVRRTTTCCKVHYLRSPTPRARKSVEKFLLSKGRVFSICHNTEKHGLHL